MPDIEGLLRRTALFRRVGPDDRSRLAAVSRAIAYERGDTIFTEGDPSDDLLVVARGRVKVFNRNWRISAAPPSKPASAS